MVREDFPNGFRRLLEPECPGRGVILRQHHARDPNERDESGQAANDPENPSHKSFPHLGPFSFKTHLRLRYRFQTGSTCPGNRKYHAVPGPLWRSCTQVTHIGNVWIICLIRQGLRPYTHSTHHCTSAEFVPNQGSALVGVV